MKVTNKINRKRLIIGAVVGLAVYTVIVYGYSNYAVPKSEPYIAAMTFLGSNNRLTETMGGPLELKMKLIGGHNISYYSDSTATAYFNIIAKGSKNSGTVIVRLKKDSTAWQLTEATLYLHNDVNVSLYPDK